MDYIFLLPLVIITIFFGRYCLIALLLLDDIIDFLYVNHYSIWEKEGKPDGWKWRNPEKDIYFSNPSTISLIFRWSSKDPDWLSINPFVEDKFSKMMHCNKMFWIGIPITLLTLVLTGFMIS